MKIISTFSERSKEISERGQRCFSGPLFVQDHPVAYFDGVVSNEYCGAGFVLKLEKRYGDKRLVKSWTGY